MRARHSEIVLSCLPSCQGTQSIIGWVTGLSTATSDQNKSSYPNVALVHWDDLDGWEPSDTLVSLVFLCNEQKKRILIQTSVSKVRPCYADWGHCVIPQELRSGPLLAWTDTERFYFSSLEEKQRRLLAIRAFHSSGNNRIVLLIPMMLRLSG